MAEKWIQSADIHKGKLHRALGVPEDKPIPPDKLTAAKNSKDPEIRRMAALATTLKGMDKSKPKEGSAEEEAGESKAEAKAEGDQPAKKKKQTTSDFMNRMMRKRAGVKAA